MPNHTKPIDGATPLDDISGLKLPKDKIYSLKEIYAYEANNIALAILNVKWQEDLLSNENPQRDKYIQALKMADNNDYRLLIEMHKNIY